MAPGRAGQDAREGEGHRRDFGSVPGCAGGTSCPLAGAVTWEKQTLGSGAHVTAHHMQSCLQRRWPLYENWKKPPLTPGKQSHVSIYSSR